MSSATEIAKYIQENNSTALASLVPSQIDPNSLISQFKFKNINRTNVPLLCIAAACDAVSCAQVLVQAGADLEKADASGNRPVHWACNHGNHQMLAFLAKQGAEMNPTSTSGVSLPIFITCKPGYLECVKVLISAKVSLDQQDGTGRTALHLSSWFNHPAVVSLLLANGANIGVTDFAGHTPLHLACWFGHVETAEILIKAGAKINALDQLGRTPLHFACQHNHPGIVGLLLKSGADTKTKDVNGKTAEAVATEDNCIEIVEMLQKHNKEAIDLEAAAQVGRPTEQELLEEHQRMRALITKLADERDQQFEKLNALKDRIESQGATLQSLQANNSELEREFRVLVSTVHSLYAKVAFMANGSSGSFSNLSNLQNSMNLNQVQNPNPNQRTASIQAPQLQQQSPSPQLPSSMGNAAMSNLSNLSSGGVPGLFIGTNTPLNQPPSYKPPTKPPLLCSICQNNHPQWRCKVCRASFCKDCSSQVQEKGCPFCQMNNTQRSWLMQ